jgi:hypothetical protein
MSLSSFVRDGKPEAMSEQRHVLSAIEKQTYFPDINGAVLGARRTRLGAGRTNGRFPDDFG